MNISERQWCDNVRESVVPTEEMSQMAAAVPIRKKNEFDPTEFLATIGEGRRVVRFWKKQTIFAQGDPADAVFYIQSGRVQLNVVSKIGKEATIGILNNGD